MDARTLSSAMGGVMSLAYYQKWLPEIEEAMRLADCNTVARAAVLLGEIREESVGLKYSQEIGSSSYLRGQSYWPYIGRGFIQVTWRDNYAAFGAWAHSRGLVADPGLFVNNPSELARKKWAAKTIAWYWSENHGWVHGTINAAADAHDWDDASHQINGGDNGLDARRSYIQHALSLGDAILPGEDLLAAMGFKNQRELDAHIKAQTERAVEAYLKQSGNSVEKMIAGALTRAGRWRASDHDGLYVSLARRLARIGNGSSK